MKKCLLLINMDCLDYSNDNAINLLHNLFLDQDDDAIQYVSMLFEIYILVPT